MKKIALLSLLLISMLCGCGNDESKGASTKQIEQDIVDNGINTFFINNQPETLDVTDVELTKRKVNEGYDDAYITASFENDYYNATSDILLHYSYYDVGGWIMDTYEILGTTMEVKQSPFSEDDFLSFASSNFATCNVTNRENGIDPEGFYYDRFQFNATVDCNYLTLNVDGDYTMTFINDTWHELCTLNSVTEDWSNALGTWSYREDNEQITIDIVDIVHTPEDTISLTYSYNTSGWSERTVFRSVSRYEPLKSIVVPLDDTSTTVLGTTINHPKSFYIPLILGTSDYYDHDKDCLEQAHFTIENGIQIHYWNSGTMWESTADFQKTISQEELQSAIDKLKEMNS